MLLSLELKHIKILIKFLSRLQNNNMHLTLGTCVVPSVLACHKLDAALNICFPLEDEQDEKQTNKSYAWVRIKNTAAVWLICRKHSSGTKTPNT